MQTKSREAVELLARLISTPSVSRNEGATADIIAEFLRTHGVNDVRRLHNNVWAYSAHFESHKPTLLLNSHHDTVRPSASYTRDPYAPTLEQGRLYGLGSNDAGASVVSLLTTFCTFYNANLPFNLLIAITAEEECMGERGIRAAIGEWGKIDMAVVGEPTQMNAAIGERGLVVLDCVAHGVSGHAARDEGENALYKALDDIERLRHYTFARRSTLLGDIRMTATQISAGTQHNVIPDECRFVVDLRTTDAYTNEEVVEILRSALTSKLTPRSTRVRASAIELTHPIVRAAVTIGRSTYVSPTTSDMALMPFPSMKMGVGDSARSHTADEFVGLDEIKQGIEIYHNYIEELAKIYETLG